MGRATADDFLGSAKYHVVTEDNYLEVGAGFSAVTTPEVSIEQGEYKEGLWTYTRKYAGNPTFSDITLSRGTTRADTNFWDWVMMSINGEQYRQTIEIRHYHRDAGTPIDPDGTAIAKKYNIFEAQPIRCKIAGDMDATASDINIQELDLSMEYFELEVVS
jgi:phage tail-like protein